MTACEELPNLAESDIARYCTEESFERGNDYYYRMDNLLNREEEPEDAILAASAVLQRLVAQARQEPASPDWERDLDEL